MPLCVLTETKIASRLQSEQCWDRLSKERIVPTKSGCMVTLEVKQWQPSSFPETYVRAKRQSS